MSAHDAEPCTDVCRRCGLSGLEITNYGVACYVGVRLRQWLVRAWWWLPRWRVNRIRRLKWRHHSGYSTATVKIR